MICVTEVTMACAKVLVAICNKLVISLPFGMAASVTGSRFDFDF